MKTFTRISPEKCLAHPNELNFGTPFDEEDSFSTRNHICNLRKRYSTLLVKRNNLEIYNFNSKYLL